MEILTPASPTPLPPPLSIEHSENNISYKELVI